MTALSTVLSYRPNSSPPEAGIENSQSIHTNTHANTHSLCPIHKSQASYSTASLFHQWCNWEDPDACLCVNVCLLKQPTARFLSFLRASGCQSIAMQLQNCSVHCYRLLGDHWLFLGCSVWLLSQKAPTQYDPLHMTKGCIYTLKVYTYELKVIFFRQLC